MNKLQKALELAEYGFHVFPLVPDSKLPLIDGWQARATRNKDTVVGWWTCPVLEIVQDYNIGICTSRFGDDKALLVIDVDNKNGKNGSASLKELEGLKPTLTSETPTGGKHIIFIVDKGVKNSAGKLGEGLDVRSHGGFIVAPGSTIGDKSYNWISE